MTVSTARRRFFLPFVAALAVVAALSLADARLSTVSAAGQRATPDAPSGLVPQTPVDGDFTWELAARGIFADQRVRMAIVLLVDESAVMSAAGLDGQSLVYREPELRQAIAGVPVADAQLLLAASGIAMPGEPVPLVQARVCGIWTPADVATRSERKAIIDALSGELVRVFGDFGVAIDRCKTASDAAEADFVVSTIGLGGLPALSEPNPEAFVSFQPPSPGHVLGDAPLPGAGGTAGLHSSAESGGGNQPIIGILLAAALILVGRWRTTDRSRLPN